MWVLAAAHQVLPMATGLPCCRNRAGPVGTHHRNKSRQHSWLLEVGQGLSTATLRHTAQAGTPVPFPHPKTAPTTDHTQPPQLPCKNPRLTRGPVEIYLFFVLSVFPQVAFPCKMPDMTPEGNLGVGAPQGLKYKLEGRAQVGQARDSTRDMASQVETKGLFFSAGRSCARG